MSVRVQLIADLGRALLELLAARMSLAVRPPRALLRSAFTMPDSGAPPLHLPPSPPPEVSRVAYAIPRVAARVPWRADCLVQALAARRWLGSLGIESELFIGVRKVSDELDAHAWLRCHGIDVTGGRSGEFQHLRRAAAKP